MLVSADLHDVAWQWSSSILASISGKIFQVFLRPFFKFLSTCETKRAFFMGEMSVKLIINTNTHSDENLVVSRGWYQPCYCHFLIRQHQNKLEVRILAIWLKSIRCSCRFVRSYGAGIDYRATINQGTVTLPTSTVPQLCGPVSATSYDQNIFAHVSKEEILTSR